MESVKGTAPFQSARPGEFCTDRFITFSNRVTSPLADFWVLKWSNVSPSASKTTSGGRASGWSKVISTFLNVSPLTWRM